MKTIEDLLDIPMDHKSTNPRLALRNRDGIVKHIYQIYKQDHC
jgi:hypothetical protein